VTGPFAERFWAKVAKGDGCWEWQGNRNGNGYGLVAIDGRQRRAHRVAWELAYGPIPEAAYVCHRCDNPPCVRPDHLFLGSPAENTRDMVRKDRASVVGRTPARRKLTVEDVAEIRRLYADGMTQPELGPKFGVHNSTICRVVNGRSHPPAAESAAVLRWLDPDVAEGIQHAAAARGRAVVKQVNWILRCWLEDSIAVHETSR
jgi:HNH endonuclease/Helix-turn-helix domain